MFLQALHNYKKISVGLRIRCVNWTLISFLQQCENIIFNSLCQRQPPVSSAKNEATFSFQTRNSNSDFYCSFILNSVQGQHIYMFMSNKRLSMGFILKTIPLFLSCTFNIIWRVNTFKYEWDINIVCHVNITQMHIPFFLDRL